MSDSEDSRSSYKVVKLRGSDNYAEWELSIGSTLLGKGLLDIINEDPPATTVSLTANQKNLVKSHGKAWSIIIQSLSTIVQASLSSPARSVTTPNAKLLWDELKSTYSASVGSRQAALLHDMWTTPINEGEDPTPHMARIRSAHAQINGGGENLSDKMLAFAMTMALPESFATLKQTMWLREPISSAAVAGAVQAEWSRRQTDSGMALLAKYSFKTRNHNSGNSHSGNNKPRQLGPNPNAYCDNHKCSGHSTANCKGVRKFLPNSTNVTTSQNNLDSANLVNAVEQLSIDENDSDCSAFFVTAQLLPNDCFIIDSGASHHMVNNSRFLSNLKSTPDRFITVGNGHKLVCNQIGTLKLGSVNFDGVLVVKGLDKNLISVGKSFNGQWEFSNKSATFYNRNEALMTAQLVNGLYTIKASDLQAVAVLANADSKATNLLSDWHHRLGHLNVKSVMDMSRDGRIDGLSQVTAKDVNEFRCEACIMGKGKRLPAPPTEIRQSQPLAIVHIDIWGPASVKSLGGARYFLTCYDDFTRKVCLTFLKQKSEALAGIKQYIATVERQTSCKVKIIRSDNGGEFTSNNWSQYMRNNGIEHHFTPPDSHAQNGRVEQVHLTVLNGVRTILCQTGFGPEFWAEVASYIAYTRNRTPCGPQKQIPDDLWQNHKTRIDHLQPFGCKVFYRNYNNASKLSTRYNEARLMGYVEGTHNYRVWDPIKRHIIKTRDVIFVNSPETLDLTQSPKLLELEEVQQESIELEFAKKQKHFTTTSGSPGRLTHRLPEVDDLATAQDNSRADSESNNEYNSDSSDDPLLLRAGEANIATIEPKTVKQARHSGDWKQWELAMQAELAKMDKYNVWTVVNRNSIPNVRTVGAKWVYTRKIDGETGKPSKYKARWVAKGYSQIEGVDFDELFAAVAHKDTIRLFLAIVNYHNWEMDQVDIVAAFLNGDLEETIYMEPPEGSDIPNHKVLRLNKALYGLKQSPRCFNKSLDKWLQDQGFKATNGDPCLYHRSINNNTILISLHVDDQLIASNNRPHLNEFKQQLNAAFECSDSGAANYFLGFNITRDRSNKVLELGQQHYVDKVLAKFDMSDCNSVTTPLPLGFRPIPATDNEFSNTKDLPYAQLVGSILYLSTITRPDLAYAANTLSRHLSKWNEDHWKAAKHLLRYIKGTRDLKLQFNGNTGTSMPVHAFADADYGGDLETRKSTTGYLFMAYGGPVAWKSRRQPTVALSTTEAEYMATSNATRQAIWIKQLLQDLGLENHQPLVIYNDNAGSVALTKNPVHHDRTKHIAIRHHFIREQVELGSVNILHVPSGQNIADFLTKPLPKDLFDRLRLQSGLTVTTRQVGVSK